MPLARLVLALTLVAPAVVPAAAAAQISPDGNGAVVDVASRQAAPPFEVGGTMGLAAIFPTFGGTVSIPVARRASVEVVGQLAPWRLDDGDDTWLMTQIQVRLPFRERPRARRSLILGVTGITVGDRFSTADRRREWDLESWIRPHAGVSWQWQRSSHVDMRLDVLAVFLGERRTGGRAGGQRLHDLAPRTGVVVRLAAMAVALVAGSLLAVPAAAAQTIGDEAPDRIGPRLEVGGGAGLTVAYPEISALVSVPIGPQMSFEVAVGVMPRIIYDVEHVLAQAQFRLPFGAAAALTAQPAARRDTNRDAAAGPRRQRLLGRRHPCRVPARRRQPAVADGASRRLPLRRTGAVHARRGAAAGAAGGGDVRLAPLTAPQRLSGTRTGLASCRPPCR